MLCNSYLIRVFFVSSTLLLPLSYLSLQGAHKRVDLEEERTPGHLDPRLLQGEHVLPGHRRLPDGSVGQVQHRVALVTNLEISSVVGFTGYYFSLDLLIKFHNPCVFPIIQA